MKFVHQMLIGDHNHARLDTVYIALIADQVKDLQVELDHLLLFDKDHTTNQIDKERIIRKRPLIEYFQVMKLSNQEEVSIFLIPSDLMRKRKRKGGDDDDSIKPLRILQLIVLYLI